MKALCIYVFFFLGFITEASVIKWDEITPIPLNLSESAGHYIPYSSIRYIYAPDCVLKLAQACKFHSNTVETSIF